MSEFKLDDAAEVGLKDLVEIFRKFDRIKVDYYRIGNKARAVIEAERDPGLASIAEGER